MGRTVVSEDGGFEWDEDKAASNLKKHGVAFEEALTVFADERADVEEDALDPERCSIVGHSAAPRLLYVVFVERVSSERVRIISARKATNHEAKRLGGA